MNQDLYVSYIGAKAVVVAWVGSVLGPIYIYMGWGDYESWPIYVGLALTVISLLSIRDGLKALEKNIYSDFVAYTLVTILIPIVVFGYYAIT